MGQPVERSPWVKIDSVYHVLEIWMEPGRIRLRLVGEEPTPALFQPEMFEVVSSVIPPTWVVTIPRGGGLSLAPEPWNATGFWERFFDAEPEAVAVFEDERAKIVAADP
ncbi:MAG: hypothetical protein JWP97_1216 [Labilithrix sp.]|nr:hypothetical protein [Labilithrix sp.]